MRKTCLYAGYGVLMAWPIIVMGQGSLIPSGPPQPTMLRLDQVEPRMPIESVPTVIDESGHYYLTGDLFMPHAGMRGIMVEADDVTIDLNGFSLVGPGANSLDGIRQPDQYRNLTIKNGVVRNWQGSSAGGIIARGTGTKVINVHVTNNAFGMQLMAGGLVSDSFAMDNTTVGIDVVRNVVVRNSRAYRNGLGIHAVEGNTISHSVAYANQQTGIYLGDGNSLSHSTSFSNGVHGVFAVYGNSVVASTAMNNASNGIHLISGNTVTQSSSWQNGANGMRVGSGNNVYGNAIQLNAGHGMLINMYNRIADNQVDRNGNEMPKMAGLYVEGLRNRIEGNNVSRHDIGFFVTGAGNYIVRNSASGNSSNWSVVVGNTCLVVAASTTDEAIEGNSGGVSPGAMDPLANVTY